MRQDLTIRPPQTPPYQGGEESSPPNLGGVPKGRGGSTGCPVVRLCDASLDAGYAYRKALLPG